MAARKPEAALQERTRSTVRICRFVRTGRRPCRQCCRLRGFRPHSGACRRRHHQPVWLDAVLDARAGVWKNHVRRVRHRTRGKNSNRSAHVHRSSQRLLLVEWPYLSSGCPAPAGKCLVRASPARIGRREDHSACDHPLARLEADLAGSDCGSALQSDSSTSQSGAGSCSGTMDRAPRVFWPAQVKAMRYPASLNRKRLRLALFVLVLGLGATLAQRLVTLSVPARSPLHSSRNQQVSDVVGWYSSAGDTRLLSTY